MTQVEKITKYMEDHGSITQREAFYLGCQRLASRIHDMKRSGTAIETKMKKVRNADGTETYVAEYSLKEGNTNDRNV